MNLSGAPRTDLSEFKSRHRWFAVAVLVGFIAVLARLFQLQILEGQTYAKIAHENIIRRVTVPTTRGVIRDGRGKVLASSRPSFNVYLVPGRVSPSLRPGKEDRASEDVFSRVADLLRLNPAERPVLLKRMATMCASDDDKSPCWHRVLVKEDVDRDIVAEIRQHTSELPGVEVVSVQVRYYPFKHLSSHALGYVAEIGAESLAKVRPEGYETMTPEERARVNPLGYEVGDTFGATGIERAWESYLRGRRGWEKRVVDARGRVRTGTDAERIIDAPARLEPIPGKDLRLTLDMDLVSSMEKAFRSQPAGAAVVLEAKTGRVLGLYSKPDFDPNDLSGAGGRARVRETFARLYADPLRPMLDKTMSGSFQPGSTFKPFSALAALENNSLDPDDRERCDGFLLFGRRVFHCSHVHGQVNMRDAIAESCNVYFYKVAETATLDPIAAVAREFGFGTKSGLGLNPEAAGRVPTRAWYALHYRGQFRVGFTLNTAIGQGANTASPLQLALAYAGIANGGVINFPSIVRAVETQDGSVLQEFEPRVRQVAKVRPENLARIRDALYAVVNDPKGTAYPVREETLEIAGKTGTAQTGIINVDEEDPKRAWFFQRDHAWFASIYPA
ncbi:MAG: penicillin-binding protein 2, partial [Polyangiaceae bacterium]|nr:penicillin-binding protein 2 [Polyangiaceae bacterium]